jgi:hypothetical protein
MALTRKVHSRTPVAEDSEIHVSVVRVGKVAGIEIREFQPSSKTYGRGVTLPASATTFGTTMKGLDDAIATVPEIADLTW